MDVPHNRPLPTFGIIYFTCVKWSLKRHKKKTSCFCLRQTFLLGVASYLSHSIHLLASDQILENTLLNR